MLGIMMVKKRIEGAGVDVQCTPKWIYLQSLYLSAPRKLASGSGTDLDTGLAPGPGMSRWAPHAWASFVHCVVICSRRPAPRRKSMAHSSVQERTVVVAIQKARHCPAIGIRVQNPLGYSSATELRLQLQNEWAKVSHYTTSRLE